MPKKTVWEMNAFERNHYSLGGRTFRAVILLALVIGISAVGFGFYLYTSTIDWEYRLKTWQNARGAAHLIDTAEVERQAKAVLDIYAATDEKDKTDPKAEDYLALYDGIYDDAVEEQRQLFYTMMEMSDSIAVYTAAVDLEHGRRIFLVDANPNAVNYCMPGAFDELPRESLIAMTEGAKPKFMDQFYDTGVMPSAITKTDLYGYRCTAAEKLMEIDGYPVYLFFDTDMNHVADISRRFLLQYILLIALVTLLAVIVSIWHMHRTTVRPVNQLAAAAKAYVQDRVDDHRTGGYFSKLDIRTGDEIENLCRTLKAMESEAGEYVQHLTRITAEKERVSTELALANRIQTDMLPSIFPAFPERSEFDIYATMDPAKEVGGDFYDFFLIDEDRLALVMADVSGKGIPAALFMMASKILIQNYALAGCSPKEVLAATNSRICESNREEMFVTVWLGILNVKTGQMAAASAGHEYPILKKPGGAFEIVHDKHGFVIGGMKNVKYMEYEMDLEPGAKLFLYTDGVPEATNSELEMFGLQRTLQVLNQQPDASPEQLISNVNTAVRTFVGDAPQFDDLTMLCVTYFGGSGKSDV